MVTFDSPGPEYVSTNWNAAPGVTSVQLGFCPVLSAFHESTVVVPGVMLDPEC